MSTRGAVGWGNLDSWTGIFNQYDSYPDGLGAKLWSKLKELGAEELISRLSTAESWDHFMRGGLCPYCGQSGDPCDISGVLFPFDHNITLREKGPSGIPKGTYDRFLQHSDPERWVAYQKERDLKGLDRETQLGLAVAYAFKETGFPDPYLVFHDHKELQRMTDVSADKLFIEWVYVIDTEANALHVLANAHVGKQRTELRQVGQTTFLAFGAGYYAHYHVCTVPLSADELPHIPGAYLGEE